MLRPLGLLSLALSLAVAFPAQAQENSTAPASPRFLNANAALGLDGLANSAAAWGDVDADGWPELLTGGVLWRNRAGQGFEQAASIGQGLLADLDRDGDLDLFAYAGQRAFLNDGAGAFVEQDLGEFARTLRCSKHTFTTSECDFWTLHEKLTRIRWFLGDLSVH